MSRAEQPWGEGGGGGGTSERRRGIGGRKC